MNKQDLVATLNLDYSPTNIKSCRNVNKSTFLQESLFHLKFSNSFIILASMFSLPYLISSSEKLIQLLG